MLSLLGLVRHMAEVERSWFRTRFAGQRDLPYLYCSDEFPDVTSTCPIPPLLRRICGPTGPNASWPTPPRRAGRSTTPSSHPGNGTPMTCADLPAHDREYARHNGHADILREQIDGVAGD